MSHAWRRGGVRSTNGQSKRVEAWQIYARIKRKKKDNHGFDTPNEGTYQENQRRRILNLSYYRACPVRDLEARHRQKEPDTDIWWSRPGDTCKPKLYDFLNCIRPCCVNYHPSPKGEGFTEPLSGTLMHVPSAEGNFNKMLRDIPMPAKDGYSSICGVRKQVADFLLKVWSADQLFHFLGNPVSVPL